MLLSLEGRNFCARAWRWKALGHDSNWEMEQEKVWAFSGGSCWLWFPGTTNPGSDSGGGSQQSSKLMLCALQQAGAAGRTPSWAVLTELCPEWESSAYSVPLWCSPCPEQSGIAEGQECDKLLQACPFSLRRRVWILLISASWPLRKGLFFIIFFMLWNWLWNSRLQWVGRYWQNSTLLRGVNLLLANYPQCLNSSLLLLIFKIFPKHVN